MNKRLLTTALLSSLCAATLRTIPASAQIPVLTITRDLRIDGNAANLSAVGEMRVAKDGTIIVVQEQDGLLRYFTPSGRALGTFGHKGAGPGEFQRMGRTGWSGDSLWVLDNSLRRLTIISPTRTLVHTVHVPEVSGTVKGTALDAAEANWGALVWGRFSNGDLLIAGSFVRSAKTDAWQKIFARDQQPIARVTATGTILSVPLFRTSPTSSSFCIWELECVKPEWAFVPDANRFVEAVPLSIVPSNGTYTYLVTARDGDGKVLFATRIPLSGPPLPPRQADSIRSAVLADARASRQSAAEVAKNVANIQAATLPSIKFPVTLIFVGRDGSTWIRLRTGSPSEDRPWVVLDRNGAVYGRVNIPAGISPKEVSLTVFWGTETDVDGLESIVRYRVGR